MDGTSCANTGAEPAKDSWGLIDEITDWDASPASFALDLFWTSALLVFLSSGESFFLPVGLAGTVQPFSRHRWRCLAVLPLLLQMEQLALAQDARVLTIFA